MVEHSTLIRLATVVIDFADRSFPISVDEFVVSLSFAPISDRGLDQVSFDLLIVEQSTILRPALVAVDITSRCQTFCSFRSLGKPLQFFLHHGRFSSHTLPPRSSITRRTHSGCSRRGFPYIKRLTTSVSHRVSPI
jgi:hypothetical protein